MPIPERTLTWQVRLPAEPQAQKSVIGGLAIRPAIRERCPCGIAWSNGRLEMGCPSARQCVTSSLRDQRGNDQRLAELAFSAAFAASWTADFIPPEARSEISIILRPASIQVCRNSTAKRL
jgi:hypothetical protein